MHSRRFVSCPVKPRACHWDCVFDILSVAWSERAGKLGPLLIKEVNTLLAKRPFKINGRLVNLELTCLVKEATVSWRCCPSLEVVSSIPAGSTIIYRSLVGFIYVSSCQSIRIKPTNTNTETWALLFHALVRNILCNAICVTFANLTNCNAWHIPISPVIVRIICRLLHSSICDPSF